MNYEHISEALKFNQADYLGFLMQKVGDFQEGKVWL